MTDTVENPSTWFRWRLFRVKESLPFSARWDDGLLRSWSQWQDGSKIPSGTPYLLSPRFEYDTELNEFFYSTQMLTFRMATRIGYAQDVKTFLSFITSARGGIDWRHVAEEDHRAYFFWRREDIRGPRVSGATWDREVSALNRFYRWQISRGHVAANPIAQRARRHSVEGGRRSGPGEETPAAYSHSRRREHMQWFPATSYRTWRDVGIRGYTAEGLPDPTFRGRYASRNTAFVDMMVRTGLRVAEQTALLSTDIPQPRGQRGYQRFWLDASIAKAGSARWIYVPESILRDLAAYAALERRDVINAARAKGRYDRVEGRLLVSADGRAASPAGSPVPVKITQLTAEERNRLFVVTPGGLEPAAFWLTEDGMPVSLSTWKDLFRQANARCARHGLDLHGHAHMLRHTFAVLTLEQLQRGHIQALAELNPAQRQHYTRIFGDPLDWVRRRLGHKSVTTTQVYLHALEELEMETRMALVGDKWEDPRDPRLLAVAAIQAKS